jgi:class 3 adenylate cyclase
MPAQTRCLACRTEARVGARFCDGCGAPLQQPQPAEYKQVTVLFADVVRSMDIAAALGPERLRELMTDVLVRAEEVVRRYDGTLNQFTGDGIMALFGAPRALEDHARRACLAALGIQARIDELASDVAQRDGLKLQLRIGLNSGIVVTGDIGSDATTYTAFGRHVGMAQRMESAAPAGGVMLSESTARLVEDSARLAAPEMVRIKGASEPVPARRLLAVIDDHSFAPRRVTTLVGRQREMATIVAALEDAIDGRGRVIGIKGPPGIGKSRIIREAATIATGRAADVISTFCESHSSRVPFHAVAGLLREFFGVDGLDRAEAAARTRRMLPDAAAADLEMLDDLLGIAHGGAVTDIDPDARRRRLATLLDTALHSRPEPAVYLIDDAQWIDAISESMLTDFISTVPMTHALVLITYRPEYRGTLTETPGFVSISLPPLDPSATSTLMTELLGSHPSVEHLATRIADRSAGNPFFTEEMVRDLAERGVLEGERGAYICRTESVMGDVVVPATVQATIAARIDRLGTAAKRTINGASVIGSRFDDGLLAAVLGAVAISELIEAELIERVSPSEYAFRHPLIHAVTYESQLKSSRSQLHREVAIAIQGREPDTADKNAALIATHLEAAGDLHAAFEWHMRAGGWLTHRNIAAARLSWAAARHVADLIPAEDPARSAMQIAARTLLSATVWRVGGSLADVGFDELRELTTAAGDKRSLAMAMTGLVQMLNFHGQYTEASALAGEFSELLESIGDPELTVGLMSIPIVAKWDAGEMTEALRLADRAIGLSNGDPRMGDLIIGSPLAFALVLRASAASTLGIGGWKRDYDRSIEMARSVDKFTFCAAVMFKYIAIENWALLPDDAALRDTAEALEVARQFGDDFTLTTCEFVRGTVLVRRPDTDRAHGFELLARCRERALANRFTIIAAWCADLDSAAEKIRTGDFDTAVELCRHVLDEEIRSGEMMNRGWATTVLVDALLKRRAPGDLEHAQAAIDRLAAMKTEPVYLYHELPLLRMRTMVAKARGDGATYRGMRDRYRTRAEECSMDGHIAIAHAMD